MRTIRRVRIDSILAGLIGALATYAGLGINSAHAAPPIIQSFAASLSDSNRVTLTWQTEGGDSSNLAYIYGPGPSGDVGFHTQDGTSSFRVPFGTHRYTLAINSPTGERMTRRVEINVPPPPAPDITSPTKVRVNMFNRTAQTITWAPIANTFVRITRPDGTVATSATGSYQVTSSELAALSYGEHAYRLVTCRNVSGGDPFCGEASRVDVRIAGAQFAGELREFVTSNQSRTLSWSGSGNFWHISAPSLGIDQFLTTPSYTIPASAVTPGAHLINLVTCNYGPPSECSNRHDVKAPMAGRISEITIAPTGLVFAGSVVARITTASGTVVDVKSGKLGIVMQVTAQVGDTVTAGAQILAVRTEELERKQLIVDQNVAWSSRVWSTDFNPTSSRYVPLFQRRGAGLPLDVLAASNGDLFSIGEFSNALAQVSGAAATEHEVPLLRILDSNLKLQKVAPFGAWSGRSSLTVLGERVIEVNGDVWFTQGGQEANTGQPNHSRVIRFRPGAADNPATEDDDRFCAYNVPGDNNAVIGIAWDGTRMWVAESRSGAAPRVLSSFNPSELPCENYLDFNDPAKIAQSAHRYCTSAGQSRCFRRIELPAFLGIAHLAVDPSGSAIWFTEYYAGGIGKYDVATGAVTRFPLPVPTTFSWFESAPWQIRVDARYVYVSEYADNDLVRFDKTLPASQCTARAANGSNPCMSEIHLPVPHDVITTHSIDLRGGRLWFARENAIGYVNTATWTSGVLYTGMGNLVDPARADVAPPSYAGISVHPVTGAVVVADFLRKQLLHLVPR